MTSVDSTMGLDQQESLTDLLKEQSRVFKAQAAKHLHNKNHLEAGVCLEKALAIEPHQPLLWDALGNVSDPIHATERALCAHQRAIMTNPLNAAFLSNYGRTLIATQQWSKAAIICRQAVISDPGRLEANYNLAMSLKLTGAWVRSLHAYSRAVAIQPRLAQAHCNMAEIHALMNQSDLAEAQYHRALSIDLRLLMAWVNLGNLYLQSGKASDARRAIVQALVLKPDLAAALSSFGSLLKAEKAFAKSSAFYRRALSVAPLHVETLSNLGNALREQELWAKASDAYQSALILDPGFAPAFYNWGIGLYRQGLIDGVEKAYERAQKLMPDFPELHLNLGFLRLSLGDYPKGFALYEWRFKQPNFVLQRRSYDFPEWDGKSNLQGAKILVYAEQGLGDTLQFFRFTGPLLARGAHLTLEVQPELVDFLKGYHMDIQIVPMNQAGGDFDLHYPLMSLPMALGTVVTNIPPNISGYRFNQTLMRRWVKRLGPRQKPRIGVVLSGNPNHINDHLRSIPWEAVRHLLGLDIELICLQKEIRTEDVSFMKGQTKIRGYQGEIKSFEDTAVLCRQMDLVISVDTSVAHLAASLEIPTWILLTEMPDWRWMLGTDRSVWYPSVRLLRKKNGTSWCQLLETVRKDLLYL